MADSRDTNDATYLGDGLYVYNHGHQIELFAHDGIRKTDQVFLDESVLLAFQRWLESCS